jgi:hypothetical protein
MAFGGVRTHRKTLHNTVKFALPGGQLSHEGLLLGGILLGVELVGDLLYRRFVGAFFLELGGI